jgi:predicted transcriptional regulator
MLDEGPGLHWRLFVRAKQAVRDLLNRLPDDCSRDEVLYHLYLLQAVEEGRADAETGRTLSHAEVADELKKRWLVGAAE